jgi:hypothetical protein
LRDLFPADVAEMAR